MSGLLYQRNEIHHQIDDESRSHSDFEELENDSDGAGHLRESENQMIEAMENQMSELSRSDLLHSAPESSDNGEQQNENEQELMQLE